VRPYCIRWLVPLLLALPLSALAGDSPQVCDLSVYETLSQELHIGPLSTDSNTAPGYIVASTCKRWPYKPHLLITVVAYDEQKESEKQVVIALIDTRTNQLISHLKNRFDEDPSAGIGRNSFSIDTAQYQLAKDVRAFGVRFRNVARGANCPGRDWGDELTLYAFAGNSISSVFSLPLEVTQVHQGCLSMQIDGVAFEAEHAEISIGLGRQSKNGLANLVAQSRISVEAAEAADSKLKNHESRLEAHTFQFDGQRYRPSKNPPWWAISFGP
jgi:hypothetical protein